MPFEVESQNSTGFSAQTPPPVGLPTRKVIKVTPTPTLESNMAAAVKL